MLTTRARGALGPPAGDVHPPREDSVAKQVGAPGTSDYGPQRTTWMCSLVTNWIGDAAFLKRLRPARRSTRWLRNVKNLERIPGLLFEAA